MDVTATAMTRASAIKPYMADLQINSIINARPIRIKQTHSDMFAHVSLLASGQLFVLDTRYGWVIPADNRVAMIATDYRDHLIEYEERTFTTGVL